MTKGGPQNGKKGTIKSHNQSIKIGNSTPKRVPRKYFKKTLKIDKKNTSVTNKKYSIKEIVNMYHKITEALSKSEVRRIHLGE